MTTYTTIPNSDIDQDSPVTQPLMTALRDNPIAITEGASGAPRIANAAFNNGVLGAEKFQTGTTERDWIIARVSSNAGVIGSYMFARSTTSSDVGFGSTRAGSALRPIGAFYEVDGNLSEALAEGSAQSGTWRCMGYYDYVRQRVDGEETYQGYGATLWLRIS